MSKESNNNHHAPQKYSKKREKQTRYLSQAIQLEEAVNPHIIKATMTMISLAILVFVMWAAFTNINEVARAPGEVVPQGYQQTVQHLEGGIVKAIHVREGQIVEKDQILITLNDGGIKEELARADSRQLSLDMQEERLRAFIENRTPNFPDENKTMVSDQNDIFRSMREAREKEETIIKDQILQKKQAIQTIDASLETAQSNYSIAKDLYDRRVKLNKKGYTSDIQMLQNKQTVNEINGEIRRLKNEREIARQEITEYEGRLASLSAQHRDEAHEKLDQINAQKAENIEIVHSLKERIARLQIRAPITGIVKGLSVNTVGAVIQPGQTLMEIVPHDTNLEVLVKIMPKDIGHLKPGQPVQLKFSSFDFSRYGSATGQLDQISATTFSGTNGERYYQGHVALEKNYVGNNHNNIVIPGMTVMADIITGEKTILQYLLKPIHKAMKTAFTER